MSLIDSEFYVPKVEFNKQYYSYECYTDDPIEVEAMLIYHRGYKGSMSVKKALDIILLAQAVSYNVVTNGFHSEETRKFRKYLWKNMTSLDDIVAFYKTIDSYVTDKDKSSPFIRLIERSKAYARTYSILRENSLAKKSLVTLHHLLCPVGVAIDFVSTELTYMDVRAGKVNWFSKEHLDQINRDNDNLDEKFMKYVCKSNPKPVLELESYY